MKLQNKIFLLKYKMKSQSRKQRSRKLRSSKIRKQWAGRKETKIYNRDSFMESWEDGSTMWVVDGKGLRVFSRSKYDDKEKLFAELKPFIMNRKEYTVFAN